jgi:hypothetical protein
MYVLLGHGIAPAAFFVGQQCQLCQYGAADDRQGKKLYMPPSVVVLHLIIQAGDFLLLTCIYNWRLFLIHPVVVVFSHGGVCYK